MTPQQAAKKYGLEISNIRAGIQAVLEARSGAAAIHSGFQVGAVLMAGEKVVSVGNNSEAGQKSVCAEGVASNRLRFLDAETSKNIDVLYVTGGLIGAAQADPCWPCGGCRDELLEMFGPDLKVVSVGLQGEIFGVSTLAELHPTYFLERNPVKDVFEITNKSLIPYVQNCEIWALLDNADTRNGTRHQEAVVCVVKQGDYFYGATQQNACNRLGTDAGNDAHSVWRKLGQPQIEGVIYILGELARPSATTLQGIREFCPLGTPIVFLNANGQPFVCLTLDQALPHSFGPDNLVKDLSPVRSIEPD